MGWIMALVEQSELYSRGYPVKETTHMPLFPLVSLLSRGREGVEVDVPRVLGSSPVINA